MNSSAPVYDLKARRAARPVDARMIVDNLADGVAALDAQVRSMPFQVLTEARIDAVERNLQLLRGLCGELRACVSKEGTPA